MKSNLYIIGCGGVGSWLAPSLTLLVPANTITLVDADKLEDKNLNRQLFDKKDVGRTKAEALAKRYGCRAISEWFCEGLIELQSQDWLLVCVDNHIARRAALYECDRIGCRAIMAANETHSAEAYLYDRQWRDGPLDPRVYYPDILTDRSGDPRAAVIGCTGDVQKENPQLVTSNSLAASLAGHLFALWHLTAPRLNKKTIASLPYHFVASATRLQAHLIKDKTITERTEHERRRGSDTGTGTGVDANHAPPQSTAISERAAATAGIGEH